MNPQYDAACKQYGVPNALEHQTSSGFLPSFVPGFLQSAAPTTSAKSRRQDKKEKREKAAAALEAKAREVAAGMDVRVDKSGQLVTTVKAASDEDLKAFALWLPPVAFKECNGDIFYNPYRAKDAKDVSDFFLSSSSVDKNFELHVKKLFGVKGDGTSSTDNYKQCKQTDMVGAATGYVSEYSDQQYVSNIETRDKALVGIVHPPRTNRFVRIKQPTPTLASMEEGCWNPRSGRLRIVEEVGRGLPVKTALEEKLWEEYMAHQAELKRRQEREYHELLSEKKKGH